MPAAMDCQNRRRTLGRGIAHVDASRVPGLSDELADAAASLQALLADLDVSTGTSAGPPKWPQAEEDLDLWQQVRTLSALRCVLNACLTVTHFKALLSNCCVRKDERLNRAHVVSEVQWNVTSWRCVAGSAGRAALCGASRSGAQASDCAAAHSSHGGACCISFLPLLCPGVTLTLLHAASSATCRHVCLRASCPAGLRHVCCLATAQLQPGCQRQRRAQCLLVRADSTLLAAANLDTVGRLLHLSAVRQLGAVIKAAASTSLDSK